MLLSAIPRRLFFAIPVFGALSPHAFAQEPKKIETEVVTEAAIIEPVPPPIKVAGRPLRAEELTEPLIEKADAVLWKLDAPIGTDVPIEVAGQDYIARFEQHYHEPGGPQRPWGYHKGVTLYTATVK